MQAAVMYRTDQLRAIIGSEAFPRTADRYPLSCSAKSIHGSFVAEYRYDKRLMLARAVVGTETDGKQLRGPKKAAEPAEGLLFHHNAPQMFATAASELMKGGWSLDFGEDDASHGEDGTYRITQNHRVERPDGDHASSAATDWALFR